MGGAAYSRYDRPMQGAPRPTDIVIRRSGEVYVIATLSGDHIDTCQHRQDAMKRACSAARLRGVYVWISVNGSSDSYREILCP
jgi:hypothetical protein